MEERSQRPFTNAARHKRHGNIASRQRIPYVLIAIFWILLPSGCSNDLVGSGDTTELPPQNQMHARNMTENPICTEMTVIDFEEPPLGSASEMVIDPYVDEASGVVFTTLPDSLSSWRSHERGILGLVRNHGRSTSACVEPESDDQKLATGVPGYGLGHSGFRIGAEFPGQLPRHSLISVEIQSLWWTYGVVWLYDKDLHLTGMAKELLAPGYGPCGNPGGPRGRKVVTAESDGPVKYVVIQVRWGSIAAFVFVIDDFSFMPGGDYALDIRPGSCPNPLNLRSKGVFRASIIGSQRADVGQIDTSTICLQGAEALSIRAMDIAGPPPDEECGCPSKGPDGYPDLVLTFSTQDVVDAMGEIAASKSPRLYLTGRLWDGTSFSTSDCVRIVGSGGDGKTDGSEGEAWARRDR